jgi:hypothetical protein
MTSPNPLAEQLGFASRLRTVIITRLRARILGPDLDADLATGISPSASAAHLARADLITRPKSRRRIRAALNSAIERACAPNRRVTAEAPLSVEAIRDCRGELSRLAEAVATRENPRVQGVAIAHELASDGRGALFFQPNEKRAVERLASTISAAERALSVSSEFDNRRGSRRETLA